MGELLPFKEAKLEFETKYVKRVLKLARGNVSEASRLALKDRKDFYTLMERCGVDPKDFRS